MAILLGSLAQSVEQRTFNPLVDGSNPSRPTNYCRYPDSISKKSQITNIKPTVKVAAR